MSSPIHKSLADGRWRTFSLFEQLGNIGSEVGRANIARAGGDRERMDQALTRALELLDLTIDDPKNRKRLREICRAREVVCDFFWGDNEWSSTGESLDRWFLPYALAARRAKGRD